MELKNVESDLVDDREHLTALFESETGRRYNVFYVGDRGLRLSKHYDHFFVLGATQAYLLGEVYRHPAPVSRTLARNIRCLQKQWQDWYGRPAIEIDVEVRATEVRCKSSYPKSASFFSAGVDSLFTDIELGQSLTSLISFEHRSNSRGQIEEGFSRLDELTTYVESTGREHLKIVTNMMTEMPEFNNLYTSITHGTALASVAHALSSYIDQAVISSTHTYGNLIPWGSHPLTDILLSSDKIAISHFGAQYTRVQKTEKVGKSEAALSLVSVCSSGRLNSKSVNCSRCQKCMRTMLSLDLFDVERSKATTFDWKDYKASNFEQLYLRTKNDYIFAKEIENSAYEKNREDIYDAVKMAQRKSKYFKPVASAEMFARRRWPQIMNKKQSLSKLRDSVYSILRLRKKVRV